MSAPAQKIANMPAGTPTAPNQAFLAMAVLRPVLLRPHVNHTTNRSEKAAATLAHRVGHLRVPGCTRCQSGRGPFTSCVTVNGHFSGMCTNCKYTSAFHGCSLRLPAAAPVPPVAPLASAGSVAAGVPVALAAFVGLPALSASAAPHHPATAGHDPAFLALLDPRLFLPYDPNALLYSFAP